MKFSLVKQFIRYVSLVLVFLLSGSCYAFTDMAPAAELTEKLSSWQTFQADFSQQVYSEQGILLQTSTGTLAIARPDHFYWHNITPLEQILVGTPDQIIFYEPDLQQATIKKISSDHATQTFLELLTRPSLLAEDFQVIFQGSETYLLQPTQKTTLFDRMTIQFSGHQLLKIVLKNQLGQITEIDFQHEQLDTDIPKQLFELSLPKSVDVLYE